MSGVGLKNKTSKGGGAPPLASAPEGPRRAPPNGGSPRNAPEIKVVAIGAIAEFINGAAFKPEDWSETGVNIIRIQNLTDPNKPFNKTHRTVAKNLTVYPGDLLVSWSATLGVFEWNRSEPGLLNQHIFRVVPDEERVDKRYLRHGLERAIIDMQSHLHGATMQHVNRGAFLGTKIFLPPLPEQRRIAEVLDRAEGLRAKRREAIAQLDELPRSIFLEMFGEPNANSKNWPRTVFSNLLSNIDSGWSPVCLDRSVTGEEWGVLKLGAVTSCSYKPTENKALPPGIEFDPTIEVKKGDLLFARKNTYELVAACALVNDTPPRLMMSDLIFRFRLREDSEIEPAFLHQLLIYPTKRSAIQKLAGGTSGSMPNISKSNLQSILIEIPPLRLQQEFARRIAAVEKLKAAHRASLTQLDTLFASLQHRAFRGDL